MRHLLLFSTLLLLGCKKDKETYSINEPTVKDEIVNDTVENKHEAIKDFKDSEFPQTGKSPKDFIKETNYTILEEIKGNLDYDNFKDIVLVLRKTDDKFGNRTLLILRNQNNNNYKLFAKNSLLMGAEFDEEGNQITNNETIKLVNKKLLINLYRVGSYPSTEYDFTFKKSNLLLESCREFASGAGSHMERIFTSANNTMEFNETNTMSEEMETQTNTYKVAEVELEFSKFNPSNFEAKIEEAVNKESN